MEPRNRCQGINYASLCCLAGRYDNPILPRFLAPIDCLTIPAPAALIACLKSLSKTVHIRHQPLNNRQGTIKWYQAATTLKHWKRIIRRPYSSWTGSFADIRRGVVVLLYFIRNSHQPSGIHQSVSYQSLFDPGKIGLWFLYQYSK